jgi:hypothetical protein
MSALPPEAVVERTSMDGRFVPTADVEVRNWQLRVGNRASD